MDDSGGSNLEIVIDRILFSARDLKKKLNTIREASLNVNGQSKIFTNKEIERRQQLDDDSASKRCQNYEPETDVNSSTNDEADDNSKSRNAVAQVMKGSNWEINTKFEGKRIDYSKICSICLSGSSNFKKNNRSSELITPCLCTGKRSHQHRSCIESWIEQTGVSSCPFCLVRYEYTKERKSFIAFTRSCELEHEFFIGFMALLFSSYLLSIGLTICCDYLFAIYKCDDLTQQQDKLSPSRIDNWLELEKLVDCYRSMRDFDNQHTWSSILLLCFACVSSVLLLIAIVSTSLSVLFRYYIKYQIWSKLNFTVRIKPYRLDGLTSTVLADGIKGK